MANLTGLPVVMQMETAPVMEKTLPVVPEETLRVETTKAMGTILPTGK